MNDKNLVKKRYRRPWGLRWEILVKRQEGLKGQAVRGLGKVVELTVVKTG